VRYTEKDIEAIAADGNRIHLYFTLKDKCGDYGLISVMIMNAQPDKSLFIENWLMSCRVLKRGMEEFIINTTVATARNAGFHKIIGEYLPTPKNAMVKDMYSRLGFSSIGEGRFVVDVDTYTPFRTYISITQGDPKNDSRRNHQ
jgi:FkbH-like protein